MLKILPTLAEVFDETFAWSWKIFQEGAGAREVVMPFTQEERDTILQMVEEFDQVFLYISIENAYQTFRKHAN